MHTNTHKIIWLELDDSFVTTYLSKMTETVLLKDTYLLNILNYFWQGVEKP